MQRVIKLNKSIIKARKSGLLGSIILKFEPEIQLNISESELSQILGCPFRKSEILNEKGKLSLVIIRKCYVILNIPAEIYIHAS
jgi:hypothetical protein